MHILKIISPLNNNYPSIENFDPKKEFSHLKPLHKAVTIIATSIITLATLGIATGTYFHKLVGRFRKLELDQENKQSNKIVQVAAVGLGIPVKEEPVVNPPPPQHVPPQKPLPPVPVKLTTPPAIPVKKTPPPAPPQVAPAKPVEPPKQVTYDSVEKAFWEDHMSIDGLHRFIEMVAINLSDDPTTAAAFVVDHYIGFKQKQNNGFAIADAHKASLVNSVSLQLKNNMHPPHPEAEKKTPKNGKFEGEVKNLVALPNGRQLLVYDTVADGSCGVHALLGEPDARGRYRTDAATNRKEFCDWLEKKHKDRQLPDGVKYILEDYFKNFKLAPPQTFKDAVQSQYDRYWAEYAKLSVDDPRGKAIIDAFIAEPKVFDVYLAGLRNTSRYLLKEELLIAAEFFNKHVILYQIDPVGKEKDVEVREANASAPGEPVHIWYNGYNHYERAAILT